ncbi:MAG: hypothetical protein AB1758_06390 [Candidatus Eremiobacterota bacterium]
MLQQHSQADERIALAYLAGGDEPSFLQLRGLRPEGELDFRHATLVTREDR